MTLNYMANIGRFLPEIVTVLTMLATMLMEATYGIKEKSRTWVGITACIGIIVAIILCLMGSDLPMSFLFTKAVVTNSFTQLAKAIMLLSGLGCIYINYLSKDIYPHLKSEYLILMLGVIAGGMLLIGAQNLLTFYLGIETLSILSYVMASLKKYNTKSNEAGIKYALYGGLAAAMMLFGMAHIYGVLGVLDFSQIGEKLASATLRPTDKMILAPSFLLFLVGIGFKVSMAPFHMWTPDVYEGAPIPTTTFFALVPKLAGIIGLIHATTYMITPNSSMYPIWMKLLSLLAVVTMFVGNISAINQKSIKRMLAYSSIAHAGYMIVGVIINTKMAQAAIIFYAFNYLFMLLSAFIILTFISNTYGNDHFDRFKGFFYRSPVMSIALMMSMFSLAGLPPFGGFVAKYQLINAAISSARPFYFLVTMIVINSVISLYYYMKIVRLMVLREPESNEAIGNLQCGTSYFVVILTSLPILLLGLYWGRFFPHF